MRGGGQCVPSGLYTLPPSFPSFHPPPPLQQRHRNDKRLKPPPGWEGEGGEVRGEEGGEGFTCATATSQLLERPLGGWTGQYLPSQTTLIKSVTDSARSLGG